MFGQNKSFGGGSSFGASSGSSLFGSNQNKTGLFGQTTAQNSSGIFGQNQNKPAGSLFGSSTQQSTSLFGSPQQPSNTGSLFGNSNNASKSIFGSSGTTNTTGSGGLFGSSTASTGGTGLFGSSGTTSTGSGIFGSSVSTVTGTTIKFEPLIGSDSMMRGGTSQNNSTKHMCITAMPKYESKCIEELRIEDYIANRKTPGAGTSGGGGLFGASTTNQQSGGLFGSSTPQKSLFGATSGNSSFGSTPNTNQGSSLFGNSNQGTSLFGQKPATTGGGLFGTTTGASTFGATNTGGSLFGNQPQQQQQTSLFGQPQQQTQQQGSLFGNTTNTGGSLFGNNQNQQSKGLFGGTTSGFGQPATTTSTGGLFGNTSNTATTGSSLFGSKPATNTGFGFGTQQAATTNAFGQPAANTSGGLFGSNTAKPGGLFGSTPATGTTGGTLFGTQPTATSGGLFGSTNQPLSGFGVSAQQQVAAQPQVAPVPVIGMTADVLQMQANMKLLQNQLTHAPYGDSPLLKYAKETDGETKDSPSSNQRQLRFLASKKGLLNSPSVEKSSFINAPITKVMSDLSPAVKSVEVTKELNYISKETPPTLGKGLRTQRFNPNSSVVNQSLCDASINRTVDSALEVSLNGTNSNRLGVRGSVKKSNLKQLDLSVLNDSTRYSQNRTDVMPSDDPDALPLLNTEKQHDNQIVTSPQNDPVRAVVQRNQDREKQPPTLNLDTSSDETTCIDKDERGLTSNSTTSVITSQSTVSLPEKSSAGVKLTKPDYFSIPTINEMKHFVKNGKVVLENGLTIGRASYGTVFWPGRIELKNIVLDEIVVFRHREVTVYPNEQEKPQEGEELNRPAEITLERVWYTDKKTKQEVRDVVKLAEIGWREHLERQTIRMGATFKDFRPESGSWVFRVEHFSKYGLADDEEPMEVSPVTSNAQQPLQQIDLNSSLTDVQNQVQRQKIQKNTENSKVPKMTIHRVPPAEQLNVDTFGFVKNKGLGGGLVVDDPTCLSTSVEYQMDETEFLMEEGEQPEKKPKIEVLTDLEFESSKYFQTLKDLQILPKCVEAKHQFNGGESEKTIIGYKKSKLIDMAITKGRSSRVGWSDLGSLVWSAQPEDNQILWGTIDRSSDVNTDIMIEMCEVNVKLSETGRKGPKLSNEQISEKLTSNHVTYGKNWSEMLRNYIEISKAGEYDEHVSVWKLCSALFPSARENGWSFERGENVGNWLRYVASKNMNKEKKHFDQSKNSADLVWQQLCVGNIEQAFNAAAKANLLNLASSLYASTVSPEVTINCYRKQIESWQNNDALHLINPTTLKCYLILSGVSHKEWTFNGKTYSVNCLEGLHWTQALGIHVWYLRGWNGLEKAYQGYVKDVEAGRAVTNCGDLYGELIKLACDTQHSIEMVLDCAAGVSPHDYFLSWHVWSVLYSVGYRTMSKSVETRLHRNYSAQLENAQLAKLAVFILQHIDNDDERATSVRGLLERVAKSADQDLFKSIVENLFVSKEWVAHAQYVAAKSTNDVSYIFELAVEAKNAEDAQRLFVDEIAPNAVVTGDLNSLQIACRLIESIENIIPEWGANGKVYVDYCHLMSLIEKGDEIEDLQEALTVLEDRLHAPMFKNTVQRLALQTIARQLFEYRSENNTVPEWTKLLGLRQMHKMFRDYRSLEDDRFTIEFK